MSLAALIAGVAGALTTGVLRDALLIAAGVAIAPVLILTGLILVVEEGLSSIRGSRSAHRRGPSRLIVTVAAGCAVVGVVWYALAPGVGPYQASGLLTLPMLFITAAWLHRHLPIRVQWTIAVVLAPIGPAGYLVFGGSQWWRWGQLSVLPFVLLVVLRGLRTRNAGKPEPWYGGPGDGPWGPP